MPDTDPILSPAAGDHIRFLGTAGARFAMAKQIRSSAGTFLHLKGKQILLDMGPGTLVALAKADPAIDVFALDGLILSHSHIDHSTDVNCLIDAVTAGGIFKRGRLFTPASCLEGEHAVVLRYLRGFLEDIECLEERSRYRLGDLGFATSRRHDHGVETYGLHFDLDQSKLSFLIDTRYFDGLEDEYADADVLVINMVRNRPEDAPHALHLCIEDVKRIVGTIRPRQTILTHFGMRALEAGPDAIAAEASDAVGCEIIAARDGMRVELSARDAVSTA